MKKNQAIPILNAYIDFLAIVPFLFVLATVFATGKDLENGLVSGKQFWFYACLLPAALSALFFYFRARKSPNLRLNRNDVLVLALIGAVFICAPVSSGISQKQTLFLLLGCLYFYFRIVLSSYRQAPFILSVFFILTGLAEALIGLSQLYGWTRSYHVLFRITGTFFNPGPFSGYVAMVFPLALFFVIHDKRIFRHPFRWRLLLFYFRWGIAMATILCSILILPAAMSRAAWIGLAGGSGLVVMYYFGQQKQYRAYIRKNRKKLILFAGAGLLSLSIALAGMYYMKKDSADGRALIWKVSTALIARHPAGVGLGNYPGAYGDVQSAYFAEGRGSETEAYVAGNPEYAFNEYLQVCIELGILPFFLFLVLMGSSLYRGIRIKQIGLAGSLFSLLLFAGFSYPFSVLPYLIGMVLLLALISCRKTPAHLAGKQSPTPGAWNKTNRFFGLVLLSACLLVSGLCLKNIYPSYPAYQEWYKSKRLYHTKLYAEAGKAYAPLYPFLSDRISFLFEYGHSLSNAGQYIESNTVLEKATAISCDPMLYNIMGKNYQTLKEYKQAEACFRKAGYLVPNRIYPYYLMALMYVDADETEKAREMAQIVLTKEPKVQSTAIEEMRSEMKKLLE